MPIKGSLDKFIDSENTSKSYKEAADEATAYYERVSILAEKRILEKQAKLRQEQNGKSDAEQRALAEKYLDWKEDYEKQLAAEANQYFADLAAVRQANELRAAENYYYTVRNLQKQNEVDQAKHQISQINNQIALDAEVTKIRSADYQKYVDIMQTSNAIRVKEDIKAEKEARKLLATTLAKDPTALKQYKADSKNKLNILKQELKAANALGDKNLAAQKKKEIATAKKTSSEILAIANEATANEYREQLKAQDAISTVKRDGSLNTDKIANKRDAAAAEGNVGGQLAAALELALAKNWNKALTSVDEYLRTYTENYTRITTRLQNSGYTYENINTLFRKNTAANPYIRYDNLLTNLNKLVEEGIATNVEQRAFLDTISEEVATTFSATQSSLLEIIRIQQADTTAQRLGLEANLTRLFNFYFGDTSYLSQAFDSIQQTLIDTSAQMSSDASIEFEYIVQKWLGSLGSVGVDTSTLQTIAQGINYLGTGNVEALSSNSALQNLLVMSANRAGLNYGTILTNGISTNETNKLLRSLVQYVQEISNSNNNVVKSAYANLFGVKMSDLAAFNNIDSKTINNIYAQAMTSNDTISELKWQLGQAGKRYHISTMIQNLLDNTFMGIGMGVANNAATYGIYRAAQMLESVTGGINLPLVSVMGNSFDLKMSLEGLIKTGIVGFSAIGQLVSSIANIFTGSALDVNKWTMDTNKGAGFRGFTNGNAVSQTTSQATYVSNTNATGTKQALVDQQKAEATTVSGNEEQENPFSKKDTDKGGADYWTNILLAIKDAVTGASADSVMNVKVTNTVQVSGSDTYRSYNDSNTSSGPGSV